MKTMLGGKRNRDVDTPHSTVRVQRVVDPKSVGVAASSFVELAGGKSDKPPSSAPTHTSSVLLQSLRLNGGHLFQAMHQRSAELASEMEAYTSQIPADHLVEFSVSGEHFTIDGATLQKFPGSLLFHLAVRRYEVLEKSREVDEARMSLNGSKNRDPRNRGEPMERKQSEDEVGAAGTHPQLVLPQKPFPSVVQDRSGELPLDPQGRLLLDRDPLVFRTLLNLLRGYRMETHLPHLVNNEALQQNLAQEVSHFLLDPQDELGPEVNGAVPVDTNPQRHASVAPPQPCFSGLGAVDGGSVLDNRAPLQSTPVGGWVSSGVHWATFKVVHEGTIGIGVMSREFQQLQNAPTVAAAVELQMRLLHPPITPQPGTSAAGGGQTQPQVWTEPVVQPGQGEPPAQQETTRRRAAPPPTRREPIALPVTGANWLTQANRAEVELLRTQLGALQQENGFEGANTVIGRRRIQAVVDRAGDWVRAQMQNGNILVREVLDPLPRRRGINSTALLTGGAIGDHEPRAPDHPEAMPNVYLAEPDFKYAPGCFCLSNDGCFHSNRPMVGRRREDVGARLSEGSIVSVEINYPRRRMTWYRGQEVVMLQPIEPVSYPPGHTNRDEWQNDGGRILQEIPLPTLSFAVMLRRGALEVVNITHSYPEEENEGAVQRDRTGMAAPPRVVPAIPLDQHQAVPVTPVPTGGFQREQTGLALGEERDNTSPLPTAMTSEPR